MQTAGEDTIRLLADSTRMKIFRAVLSSGEQGVTAAEAARRFSVHANVARMHLEKLAAAGLIRSAYVKAGGGGRPARHYYAGDGVVAIQYPPRDYLSLAEITLDALSSGRKPETEAERHGRRLGESALAESGVDREKASPDERRRLFVSVAEQQGLMAQFSQPEAGRLEMKVNNCCFGGLSGRYGGLVCAIHRSLFLGLGKAVFGRATVSCQNGIAGGGTSCHFEIKYR